MKNLKMMATLLAGILACYWRIPAQAEAAAVGMVTDVEGRVLFKGRDAQAALQPGDFLAENDVLDVAKQGNAVVVYFGDCSEWALPGGSEVTITQSGPVSKQSGPLKPSRKLPVCFRPEDFQDLGKQVIGGYIMRGITVHKDEAGLAQMRAEAERDQVETSELIALMVYDIKHRQVERARPYYERIKDRYGDAEIVRNFSRYFAPRP